MYQRFHSAEMTSKAESPNRSASDNQDELPDRSPSMSLSSRLSSFSSSRSASENNDELRDLEALPKAESLNRSSSDETNDELPDIPDIEDMPKAESPNRSSSMSRSSRSSSFSSRSASENNDEERDLEDMPKAESLNRSSSDETNDELPDIPDFEPKSVSSKSESSKSESSKSESSKSESPKSESCSESSVASFDVLNLSDAAFDRWLHGKNLDEDKENSAGGKEDSDDDKDSSGDSKSENKSEDDEKSEDKSEDDEKSEDKSEDDEKCYDGSDEESKNNSRSEDKSDKSSVSGDDDKSYDSDSGKWSEASKDDIDSGKGSKGSQDDASSPIRYKPQDTDSSSSSSINYLPGDIPPEINLISTSEDEDREKAKTPPSDASEPRQKRRRMEAQEFPVLSEETLFNCRAWQAMLRYIGSDLRDNELQTITMKWIISLRPNNPGKILRDVPLVCGVIRKITEVDVPGYGSDFKAVIGDDTGSIEAQFSQMKAHPSAFVVGAVVVLFGAMALVDTVERNKLLSGSISMSFVPEEHGFRAFFFKPIDMSVVRPPTLNVD